MGAWRKEQLLAAEEVRGVFMQRWDLKRAGFQQGWRWAGGHPVGGKSMSPGLHLLAGPTAALELKLVWLVWPTSQHPRPDLATQGALSVWPRPRDQGLALCTGKGRGVEGQ